MKWLRFAAAVLLGALSLGAASPATDPIERAIRSAPSGSYAVFDADNTIWNHDLEEALLPFLENRGTLSPAALDPSLKPVALLPGETLYGYYRRLCDIDDKICYPWIAQVFAGRSLGALKADVDAMMASTAPIPVTYRENGRVVSGTVMPPRIYPAQRALIARLKARGVRVYVVTAAAEELVRMVVSDPRYGLDVAPADVIGVTMLLRDPADGNVTTARKQIAAGHFLDTLYPPARHAAMILTPALWSPLTWYEGKVAGIDAYIDPVRRPLLVAGDSRSDWAMLFRSGAVRLWVNRSAATTSALTAERDRRAAEERKLHLSPSLPADKGWVITTPEQLQRAE